MRKMLQCFSVPPDATLATRFIERFPRDYCGQEMNLPAPQYRGAACKDARETAAMRICSAVRRQFRKVPWLRGNHHYKYKLNTASHRLLPAAF